jgi:hypothetical protein
MRSLDSPALTQINPLFAEVGIGRALPRPGAVSKIVDGQFFCGAVGSFSLGTAAHHAIALLQLIRKYDELLKPFDLTQGCEVTSVSVSIYEPSS